jgi:coenzyme F420-0:L-glutamate ligase / coenzyme F420-1:gamma-L-glutamate ligase
MRFEEFMELARTRRSSKVLGLGEVPVEMVVRAVEAGVWAANAHNSQPWFFIVVVDHEVKKRLLDEMAEQWLEDLIGDGVPRENAVKVVEAGKERSMRASALIVACLSMREMETYWDSGRSRLEYIMGVQSLAAALQNILLALHSMGYGACWRCSPLFAPEAVRMVLEIPDDVEPQAMVEVGLKGLETHGVRKPLKDVVFLNKWGVRL